jgi:hypothetical protein
VIGRDEVTDTGEGALPERRGDSQCPRVDRRIDRRTELEQQSGIAGVEQACAHYPASACSSFWWIPPKPPFDMRTTTVAGRRLRGDRPDDVVDRGDLARPLPAVLQVGDELPGGQSLCLGKARAKHAGESRLRRR